LEPTAEADTDGDVRAEGVPRGDVDATNDAIAERVDDDVRDSVRVAVFVGDAARDDDGALLVELSDFTRVALPWERVKPILATLGELYFNDKIKAKVRLSTLDAARLEDLARGLELLHAASHLCVKRIKLLVLSGQIAM
jgi:hypothetical protein